MLDIAVGHRDAVLTELKARGICNLTIGNCLREAFANIALFKKHLRHIALYLLISACSLDEDDEVLVETDVGHGYHLTLFSKALICSARAAESISRMLSGLKMPLPMPA